MLRTWGSMLLKGVRISFEKYSWHTSGSTAHKFLHGMALVSAISASSTLPTYLNVPRASSTTSRVSSLNNLIKPPTTPLESSNLRFASFDKTKLEIQAAAHPLSVASGDESCRCIADEFNEQSLSERILPCQQQAALGRAAVSFAVRWCLLGHQRQFWTQEGLHEAWRIFWFVCPWSSVGGFLIWIESRKSRKEKEEEKKKN